ncbi:MAG: AsmA family protein [Alphaproteobacteria bacterium]|nr:AsmA family protein [Alphaproteobacteria bacterium]
MKRLYWAGGLALLLLVAALALAPRFVDWNAWRGEIEAQTSAWLGLPVTIRGNLAVDLLPTPRLTASRVALGDPQDPAAEIRWARAALDLRELIKGAVVLQRVSLVEPVAHINRLLAAAAPAAAAASGAPADGGFLGGRSERPVIPFEIEDGVVRGAPVEGIEIRLDAVAGALQLRPGAQGRIAEAAFDGVATLAGRRLSGGFRLQPRQDSLRLAMEIETADSRGGDGTPSVRLTFSGAGDAATPGRLAGDLRLTAERLTRLPWLPEEALAAAESYAPGALTLEGRFAADRREKRITLDSATAATDDLRGTGGLSLALAGRPRLSMRLSLASLDLTRGAPPPDAVRSGGDVLDASDDARTGAGASMDAAVLDDGADALDALTLADPKSFAPALSRNAERLHRALMRRVAATASAARAFEGLSASVDLSADTLRVPGGVVRQASLRASADRGELLIERAAALLPGGSDVSLFGFVATAPDDPRFEGELALQSDDARRLLDWAGLADAPWLTRLPGDRLRSMRLSGSAVLDRTGLRLGDLLATIDAATLAGSADLSLESGAAALSVDLDADTLNIDAYRGPALIDPTGVGDPSRPVDAPGDRPAGVDAGAPAAGAATGAAPANPVSRRLEAASDWAAALAAAALDLDLDFGRVIHEGRAYEGVRLTLGARAGERRATLSIDRSAAASLRAGLRFPIDEPRVDWRLALRLEAPSLGDAAAALGADPDLMRRARGLEQAVLRATVDGNAAGLGFRADLGAGPDALADAPDERLSLGGVLTAGASGGLLLQISQGDAAFDGLEASGLQLAALIPTGDASPQTIDIQSAAAAVAGGVFRGAGTATLGGGRAALTLDGTLDGLSLDRTIGSLGPLLTVGGEAALMGRLTLDASGLGASGARAPVQAIDAEGRLTGAVRLGVRPDAASGGSGVRQIDRLAARLAEHFGAEGGDLSGRARFSGGRLTLSDIVIRGEGARATGGVEADFAAERLTADFAVRADGESAAYLEVEARGPIERPDVRTGGGWISGR